MSTFYTLDILSNSPYIGLADTSVASSAKTMECRRRGSGRCGVGSLGLSSRPGAGLTNEDRRARHDSATNFKPVSSFYDMQPEKRID